MAEKVHNALEYLEGFSDYLTYSLHKVHGKITHIVYDKLNR